MPSGGHSDEQIHATVTVSEAIDTCLASTVLHQDITSPTQPPGRGARARLGHSPPKEGCDPATPRWLGGGRDVLMEDGTVPVEARQVSIASDTDVVSGIHVMSYCISAVTPMLAAASQAASEVAQTRPRGYCSVNLLLPMDGSIEPLDADAPDVLGSGQEPDGGSSEVGSDVCVVLKSVPCSYDECGGPDVRAGRV